MEKQMFSKEEDEMFLLKEMKNMTRTERINYAIRTIIGEIIVLNWKFKDSIDGLEALSGVLRELIEEVKPNEQTE